MTVESLRKDVCEANKDLDKLGLLFQNMGCASAIDLERGVVVTKPAGVKHADLTPDDMLVLDLDGKVVKGSREPSTDVAAHLYLYREYKEVGGIANTSSPYATIFAQAEKPIPCLGMIHSHYFKGEIPVTRQLRKPEIERGYGRSLGSVIVERFVRLNTTSMQGVLVARHGPFVWGRTVADAVLRAVALEYTARLAMGTLQVSPATEPLTAMVSERQYFG